MVNYVQLNARNSDQVFSAQSVSVLTAEPNTWLFIYSGIAMQRQSADSDFWGNTEETDASVDVTLDNISGLLLGFASSASQAITSISDTIADLDVWSTTVFQKDNGDVVLNARTSVAGPAGFAGFSYYVSVKMLVDQATISGTIRWPRTLAAPLAPPHFRITAKSELPGSPGSFSPQWRVEATGVEGDLDSTDPTFFYVPYVITGALIGKTVRVFVDVIATSFNLSGAVGALLIWQINGPNPINLTLTNRHATNVDFEIGLGEQPH